MPSDALESILVMLAALVPIVNPLGTAPIFLAMSADLPARGRHRLAATVARNAFLLLIAAMLVGSYVLAFFGITLPVVRVAGGLVLLAAGWRLLHAGDEPDAPPTAVSDAWEREVPRRAFYPLTFPLTVGPGTISIAVTLGARGAARPLAIDVAVDLIASAIVAVAVYLSYRFASRLIARLGETGTYVFLRLSAFILLCVAVAILWSGIVGLVEPLLHTPAPQPAATLIIHNARVYTADANNATADAIAIRGDRIALVGSNADALSLRGDATRVIDAGQRAVVPGLHDAHGHFTELGASLQTVDPLEAGELADVVILNRDIMQVAPAQIPGTTVRLTLVGGAVVYEALAR